MSMTTTGIFTTHRYEVPSKTNQTHRLFIFGDVHRDSELCAEERWKEFLEEGRKAGPHALFLGMGDYLDSFSTSERDILGDGNLHETTRHNLEKIAKRKCSDMAREMKFMSGRLIGLLEGNHYASFSDGTTSTQYMCNLLGCKYLGVATFVRLSFRAFGPRSARMLAFDIHAHHGKGASRLVGGSLNRVAQMFEHCDADLVIMGHDHKRAIIPANPRLYLHESGGQLSVKERQMWIARSGSFLAAYADGIASYNVDAARGPCNLGHVECHITPRSIRSTKKGMPHSYKSWLDVKGVA